MLWVYGHYKYFNSYSAGTVFKRLNLTSTDGPRAESVVVIFKMAKVYKSICFYPFEVVAGDGET